MPDLDKPRVNLSHSQLDREVTPEAFTYVTGTNKRVTFPDLFDMDAEEGEAFLIDARSGNRSDGELLKKWLPAKDYEALRADKLTLRQRTRLLEAVLAYYEQAFGDAGEGDASAT